MADYTYLPAIKEKRKLRGVCGGKKTGQGEGGGRALDILATIIEYKQHLKAIGYAPATIANYRKYLDQFKRHLQELGVTDLRKVTHQTICDYQAAVMAESVAQETKALKIRPVKRLFEHLVATHKLLINPCEGIVETCRKHRKIGPVLTVEEVKNTDGSTQPVIAHRDP